MLPLPDEGGVRILVQTGAVQEKVVVGKFEVRRMLVVWPEHKLLGLAGFELAVGRGSTVTKRSFVMPVQPLSVGVIWYVTVPWLELETERLSVRVAPVLPGGHDTMFAEQAGGGVVHAKLAPGGFEESVMLKLTPEHVP